HHRCTPSTAGWPAGGLERLRQERAGSALREIREFAEDRVAGALVDLQRYRAERVDIGAVAAALFRFGLGGGEHAAGKTLAPAVLGQPELLHVDPAPRGVARDAAY